MRVCDLQMKLPGVAALALTTTANMGACFYKVYL
jgi:hypothetical protein